ncbi:hypothetical protein PoB_004418000 [Plakobranchus ocellatus]|uniref:Uncharacterized protein n=1 Tax=Plakobranchus ocellatus TaxID=259542 RepID=A0AAV4BDP9_9GAST|nr:hypothetical protein PoB_004418000 [Plakobranchus ocellatus]
MHLLFRFNTTTATITTSVITSHTTIILMITNNNHCLNYHIPSIVRPSDFQFCRESRVFLHLSLQLKSEWRHLLCRARSHSTRRPQVFKAPTGQGFVSGGVELATN